ncbi:zinc finger protein ZAT4-like [Euphorbia lathyris]|uniref:zinc finger protein ZAT4-like n=1 Tax=Euphorbia lathyris TaxID=212925 RepID=UPI0033136B5C
MERHKCKLCTRTFANGRALGGHMKAHLATLPLPPKITVTHHHQLGFRTESSSSSYSSSGEEHEIDIREVEDKEKAAALAYRLRENPKKSFKFADPEFSFAVDACSVVQDRESETESRNPTRRRSKRTRKSDFGDSLKQNFDLKKLKLKVEEWPSPLPPLPPATTVEPEPVSSVSDTSPEEDVAMCLMMLSRDVWMRNEDDNDDEEEDEQKKQLKNRIEMIKDENKEEIKVSKIRSGKFRCDKCMKLFRSSPALLTHKKICSLNGTELRNSDGNERIFECPYCFKVFGSGQALGGHKRSHLRNLDSAATATAAATATVSATAAAAAAAADEIEIEIETCSKIENNWIDLNLPAPMEDDEFSVVSDA